MRVCAEHDRRAPLAAARSVAGAHAECVLCEGRQPCAEMNQEGRTEQSYTLQCMRRYTQI